MAYGLPGFTSHIVLPTAEAAATLGHSLGQKKSAADGKAYRFVEFLEAVTAGECVLWDNAALTLVTKVFATAVTAVGDTVVAGIATDTITAAEIASGSVYGWVQVEGLATCFTDGLVAAGDLLIADEVGTAGRVIPNAALTALELVTLHVGVAPAADASTVGTVILQIPTV